MAYAISAHLRPTAMSLFPTPSASSAENQPHLIKDPMMNSFSVPLRRRTVIAFASGFVALASISHAADVVKIGFVNNLSGPISQAGTNSLNGAQIAVEAINAAGGIKSLGGAKLELVPVDVPTPNTAGAATQRLITQQQVPAVIGAYSSGTTLAVSEVTERAGVPQVTFSFADEITGRGYKNIFQVTPKATAIGKAQFDYGIALLKESGKPYQKIAIVYEDTAFGLPMAKGLRESAAAAGLKIVLDEAYPAGLTDAKPVVNKIRAAEPDVVLPVSSNLNDALQLVRNIRQQRINAPIIGGAAAYIIPDFQKGLGPLAEGVMSVSTANPDLAPEFAETYKKRFGSFMTHEAIMHAAAVEAVARALEQARSTKPADVRKALAELSSCEGFIKAIPGRCVQFNANGLNIKAHPIMVQWRGAEPVTIYPAGSAKAKVSFNN